MTAKKNLKSVRKKLTESAFDFLLKSTNEIKTHPKYSVIHFATAIELLLKARLMREHWTLAVERTSDTSLEDFLSGKCKTVNQADAIKRLINACGESISKDASTQFGKISAHRNRMIHFFHEAGAEQADQELMEEIVKEQFTCWFYLERLLTEWKDQFEDFENKISNVRQIMRRNREFLTVAFERLKPQIEADKKTGTLFQACSGCGFESAAVDELSEILFEKHCLVCGLGEAFLNIPCPGVCGTTLNIDANNVFECKCPICEHQVKATELAEILDTVFCDLGEFKTPMNCALCSTSDSVVRHHDTYICTVCLATEDGIEGCEWCNELQMGGGDLEWSYQTGCEFCEGQVGWTKDD